MGSGFAKMKKQAQAMQKQLETIREQKKSQKVSACSEGDLVKVTLNGEGKLLDIQINPECTSDVEGLQDLIVSAFAKAHEQLDREESDPLSSLLPF